jgi:Na+/melibiose symporter-like transporter
MTTSTKPQARKSSSWLITPALGLAIGLLFLVVFGLRGDWPTGVLFLAVMVAYSAVLVVLGRRSETVGLLGGDNPDERGREISVKALATTGGVLILAVLVMFFWEAAHGQDGNPWSALCAVAGGTFIGSTAWYAKHC